jgi:hypothetical protein
MTYETRTVKVSVAPKGEPLFQNGVTNIEIIDEASGEFLEVSQCNDTNDGKILIDPYEWPTLRAAIDKMIKECREYK